MSARIELQDYTEAMLRFLFRKNLEFISIHEDKEDSVFNVYFSHNDRPSDKTSVRIRHYDFILKAKNKDGLIFTFSFDSKGQNAIKIELDTMQNQYINHNKGLYDILDHAILEKINSFYFNLAFSYRLYKSAAGLTRQFCFLNLLNTGLYEVPHKNYQMATMTPTPVFLLNGPLGHIPYSGSSPNIQFSFQLCYEDGDIDFKYVLKIPISSNEWIPAHVDNKNSMSSLLLLKFEIEQKFDLLLCHLIETHLGIYLHSFKVLPEPDKLRYFSLLDMHII
jgi:hypothetical protein